MEELDLSSNRLKYLNEHFMHGLNNLRKLSLSHNRIETIEMLTFRNLTRLNELWLDYNGGLVVNKTSGLFVGLAELRVFFNKIKIFFLNLPIWM